MNLSGSKTSTSPQLLAVVHPEIAVISVGANNPSRHPSPDVIERLVDRLSEDKVYMTSENGIIEFIPDGERLWVKSEY